MPWVVAQKIAKLGATNHSSRGISLWLRSLPVGPWRGSLCVFQLLVFYGMDTRLSLNLSCLHDFALCYLSVSLFSLWDVGYAGLGPPCPDNHLCENPTSQYSYILRWGWGWETTIFFYDKATTDIYTIEFVGCVICVLDTDL